MSKMKRRKRQVIPSPHRSNTFPVCFSGWKWTRNDLDEWSDTCKSEVLTSNVTVYSLLEVSLAVT